ncbi:putative transcription factor PosF21 [Hibiscus syriacus]|uniref:Transcription factor PosF21 n=1 Tax=Hibiscus syriacus TaxID=106335 RepID=A0A6A2X4W5_HIBSY|nr:transcription factor RF2a-like [Hibiscus syriacus]KAE8669971.1 putative transcription factor PosF21 [Hibiscus syriacus]
MGDDDEGNTDVMQRIKSSFGTSSSSIPKQALSMNHLEIPQLNLNQMRAARHFSQFGKNFSGSGSGSGGGGGDGTNKRVGIPPSHPNQISPISPCSHIAVSRPSNHRMGSQSFSPGPTQSRSLSQPSSFFSFDSLPPLSPAPSRNSLYVAVSDQITDLSMEDRDAALHSLLPPSPFSKGSSPRVGESLPPRNKHRRSNSDVPFQFNTIMQPFPPSLVPARGGGLERSLSGMENSGAPRPAQLVKKETSWERGNDGNAEGMGERKSEREVVDDLFSDYMNLDNLDSLNSSDDKNNGHENHEDLDSRASGTRTKGGDSSDNEAESSANESGISASRGGMNSSDKREGIKRTAGGDIAPSSRHFRSVSMDSFMGKLNFGDESPKLPPSPGTRSGQLSPSNSIDGNSAFFSLELGSGEFSEAETKKIMANEKLAEIAMTDPKRAMRILANRQSAARSKERKMHYISELEHKVQTLQTEATTLSAQLTLLQRDSAGLTNQNNELKFRIQAMEQQAQLRDALNETLTAEVWRLKLSTQELGGDSDPSKGMVSQQLPVNHQMFQLHQQQSFPAKHSPSVPLAAAATQTAEREHDDKI